MIIDWANIVLRRIRAKRDNGKQVWFVPYPVHTVGGYEESCDARKTLQFYPSFKLGNSISST